MPAIDKKKKWVYKREIGACVVSFKRTETSQYEMGIAILEDTGTYDVDHIIDMDRKRVDDVYNFSLQQYDGSFRYIEWTAEND